MSLDLSGQVYKADPSIILGMGAFTNVFKGEWKAPGSSPTILVIITSFRVRRRKIGLSKRLAQEFSAWHDLNHPNIQPYLGCCDSRDIGPSISLISLFCELQSIEEYMSKNPDTDRFRFVMDVASGLAYLHSQNIIHGNLHPDNALVDDSGRTRLTDFGWAKVIGHQDYCNALLVGATGYAAPELLPDDEGDGETDNDGDDGNQNEPDDQGKEEEYSKSPFSKMSDIYALSMLMFKILSGRAPFPQAKHLPGISAMVIRIRNGFRPQRTRDSGGRISETVWGIMEECWAEEPGKRPSAESVLRRLDTV